MPSQMYVRTPPPTGMKAPPRKSVAILEEGTLDGFGTWTLHEDGLLTIEGNGKMPDWEFSWDTRTVNTPWWNRRDQVKAAVISGGVTSIGRYAFYGCSSLTEIQLPDSVTSIGEEAFKGCSSLTSITIPNGVTSIGFSAFSRCSSLTSIYIPDGITTIEQWAFFGCNSLVNITIPDSVATIGTEAFYDCSSLTHIDIPNGVTVLASGMFSGCTSLSQITIPNSVTVIGFSAFRGCKSLTQITIPNSVIKFERCLGANEAFSSCTSLQTMYMPRRFNRMFFERYYGISKNIVTFY